MSYSDTIKALKASGNFRTIPRCDAAEATVDFSQNDYLGLAARSDLLSEFMAREENRKKPLTSSAARLLAANQTDYHNLESLLSELYGGKSALLFNSGYHANTGLISALASEKSSLIVADKLVHASIIDGITLSHAPFQRFVHNDFNRLEKIIEKEADKYERVIVAVEGVYSMDGDCTDLDSLIALKRRFGNLNLYVDEAHSFGVMGRNGLGLCRSHAAFEEIDVTVGTFGKACASQGAFAVMSPLLRDYAVNRARSFIFSTMIPPLNCAWTQFMIERITEMDRERSHLMALSEKLSGSLGLNDPRYIIPFVTGSSERALGMSSRLLDCGYKVLPIRTPTVPPGTERLRISLSAAMTMADVEGLAAAIKQIDL